MKILPPILTLAALPGLALAEGAPPLALPPGLDSFVATVVADHAQTATALAAQARARAEASAADQPLYNPDLEFDAAPVAASPPDTKLSPTFTAAVRLTVDLGDKRGAKAQAAAETAQAVTAETRAARSGLAADVLAALAGLEAARQRLAAATRQSELAETVLAVATRRQAAGELPAVDFNATKLAAAEARRGRDDADLARIEAEETLRATCQCAIETAPALPVPLPTPPILTEPAIDALVEERPETEAARRRVAAARAALALARAQRLPDPTVRLGGSTEGDERRVLIGLSIPIPVRNSGAAEMVAAGRALAEAEARERQTRLDSAAAIRKASRAYRRAVEGDESWRRLAVPTQQSQSALLDRLWSIGEIGATDLLVQMRETARGDLAAIEARAAAWTAYAALYRAAASQPADQGRASDE